MTKAVALASKAQGATAATGSTRLRPMRCWRPTAFRWRLCTRRRTREAAAAVARNITQAGQPVAVKILSSDIPHKSDVDGVRLNLTTEADVEAAAASVIANAKRLQPAGAHRRRDRAAHDHASRGRAN